MCIGLQVNAAEVGDEPLGEFFHVASLLIPMYAARAWEVMEYGPDGASLATAAPVADCFQVAYYCVRNSLLHPRYASTDAPGLNAQSDNSRGIYV